jgi:hypothetical protein
MWMKLFVVRKVRQLHLRSNGKERVRYVQNAKEK